MSNSFDIAVIGAGIAGASVAAELSQHCAVVLIEMEAQPGYHSTGRSAAVFAPTYGPGPVRALTRASAAFFKSPPDGFAEHSLLTPRGALFIARGDQLDQLGQALEELGREARLEKLDAKAARQCQPLLREDYVEAGIYDPNCFDIDVHALHQGYLRAFAARGGRLAKGFEVASLTKSSGKWMLRCAENVLNAPIVVNAAGAWADLVGRLAGAEPIGLVPKRRTAMTIDADSSLFDDGAPLTLDIAEEFYAKPDAGKLLVSPANENPESPCDVQPDEMDIALCIHRIEQAFDIKVWR
ncbi:MAG: FAD-dependent oxidoreductase, partial [Pseudomonadota bacterium]